MFDYSFILYCKRLDQCVDGGEHDTTSLFRALAECLNSLPVSSLCTGECGEEDEYNQHELMSSPPSSEY